ncbi:MAG TPA: tRNA preQ1(34) S-adenosylmethionine ribosyltransferase-isomerase QueA [Gemmatimonadales bacterium]|nr:tRNA preQ1(34) S-adenosylmethionine ribosyltransferase-isomerase QueA [Gemmatimonadales bacterium]
MAERRFTASDFEYTLPPELVAQEPLPERTASRLLVVRRPGGRAAGRPDGRTARRPDDQTAGRPVLEDAVFADLLELIPPGDLLVINTTRVRPARLVGRRPSGAEAEVLLVRPAADSSWIALGRPGSALQPGKRIALGDGVWVETLEVLDDGRRRVRIVGATVDQTLERFGRVPLPPYITREPVPDDALRYQTVYARRPGSAAAPTAGLHFTNALLDALSARGVVIAGLELEVGPGTFKPVETERIEEHPMHAERYEIPERLAAVAREISRLGGRVWAVGTTVVRALESAADESGALRAGPGETCLLITPGYRFRVVDRLITNFHLPRSTLLMLASAFAGYETTREAYRHAIARRYRFYSYGDAMVII